MNLRSTYISFATSLFAGMCLFATVASADIIFEDPDVEACYGKSEAESCSFDGETGLCERGNDNTLRCVPVPEPSDEPSEEPSDEPPATRPDNDDSSACSTVLANPIVTPVLSFMLGLMILAGVRRRSSRKS